MLSREGDVGASVLLCRPTCFGSYGHLQVDRLTKKLVSSYTLACVLCTIVPA